MKDTSFSNGGFSGRAPSPPGVTLYATVAELQAAADGGNLAAGYYKTGDQVVYWDGAEFTPYLTENPILTHGIASDDGAIKIIDVIVFPDVAVDLIYTHAVGPTGMDTGAAWAVV